MVGFMRDFRVVAMILSVMGMCAVAGKILIVQESSASGFERAESAEKRLAAKGRLEEKETRKAESETLGGVLTSPRDKAMAQRSAGLPPSRAGRRSKRSSQQKS